jgi:adenine-specific DNA-methyltransferase
VNFLPGTCDYLVWYAKDRDRTKFRPVFLNKAIGHAGAVGYNRVRLPDGTRRQLSSEELANPSLLPSSSRIYTLDNLTSQSEGRDKGEGAACWFPVELAGKTFRPSYQGRWKTNEAGIEKLKAADRLEPAGDTLRYVRFLDDFPVYPITNVWNDTTIAGYAADKLYVVQTTSKVVARCLLLTTDPGDLVFDPTCGSGTTAYVAEQWGRRWITCDTSRVATTLAKQRLMTAVFDYYELAHPAEGVGSGFHYKKVPHVTLKSVANNEPPGQEMLYDQPKVDGNKVRVTGPFTVEAVPAPTVRPLTDGGEPQPADASVARSGETLRQAEWRAELLKTGIRGKNNQMILFTRVEPLAGTRWLHADAESLPNERGADRVREPRPGPARTADRVVVSFGPEHAPLEQRQVELAWEEARTLHPRPGILAFAAFQFDPEAAKDIDELTREKTGRTFLKVQMNPDLLTEDLKKKRASNESFWLMGQPDVEVRAIGKGEHKGKLAVEVHGFDYYNTKTGQIESGDTRRIALWMLDPDYDGRSLFPRQVFFPMADESGGWARLARNLKAEIDEERIEAYRGTVSLPFTPGPHKRVAVKIVDDRGIESLKVVSTP